MENNKFDRLKFDKWVFERLGKLEIDSDDLINDEIVWQCPVCGNGYVLTLNRNNYMNSVLPVCKCGYTGTRIYHKHFYNN